MRATVDGIEIEGTPAEVAEFVRSIKANAQQPGTSPRNDSYEAIQSEDYEITEKFAYRVFNRRPLSSNQSQLLSFLKSARSEWVLASDIMERFHWDGNQLGGVLGGLGRRMTSTKGYKNGYALWNWKWDDDEGTWSYSLPEAVIAALEKLDL